MKAKALKRLAIGVACAATFGAATLQAAPVDLASAPMVSGLSKVVPPNIFVVLDDSGSMAWDYLPDSVNNDNGKHCYKNFGYNLVYYNPAISYVVPLNPDGTPFAAASFTKAYDDGFKGGSKTDLSKNFASGSIFADPPQAAYYYVYTASPTSPPSTCAADSAYTKHVVTAAEEQNFANWYSYYRSRILMMKSAVGRSFATLNTNYRVGFTMISEPGTNPAKFLNIATFDPSQKTAWYNMLYGVTPTGSTPLRGALSKAGRLYAGKLVSGPTDPVQYSCQQNFTLMTTDGYWNNGSDTPTYGPFKEDNVTKVGDQDGAAGVVRPFLDAYKASNSLSDIAYYYYYTDLRPTVALGGLTADGVTRVDVSTNNVPTAAGDTATWQHMTTFTLGLGVNGLLTFDPNYQTSGTGDYAAILQGTKNWPDPQTASNGNTVVSRIDDLWHAAVNGHGRYLSAGDPASVIIALNQTLAAISKQVGAAAAAATSSLQPVAGDNFAYIAQYTTALWQGDLQARTIDLVTGALSSASSWTAASQLSAKVAASSDTRTIYTFSAAAGNKLKPFTSANLAAEKAAKYFRADGSNPGGQLTQYGSWTPAQQTASSDDTMIAYLRGQTGLQENAANAVVLYRDRSTPLGDIVNGAPVYVKKPQFNYADPGYASFATAQANRAGTVYVGANDGMLHAFDATTGAERWAYIPSVVIPNLYKLADDAYPNNHRFFVDGTVLAGDAYNGSQWSTILIGGLGDGGKAFYALDVTDPTNPKALWEFSTASDPDMGYSYGNPILTKRASDGKWVVIVASGYNNTTGDSKGRIYVLDAFSGTKLEEIVTDNSVNDPNVSGIAKITNYVESTLTDNTTQYVYGGDLGGALWRFDINAGLSQRLGKTSATVGDQPITVKPEVGSVRDSAGTAWRVVYFGTGRYLGFNDLSAGSTSATVAQAIYAVKDKGADLGVLTSVGANLVPQTLNTTVTPRTIDIPLPVDFTSQNGWYVTLPVGERIDVDLKLQLGTLVALSNVPKDDYCVVGGSSWLYAFNYATGAPVISQSGKYVGFPVGASIATGVALVKLPTGKVVALVTEADTTLQALTVPTAGAGAGGVRRVSWREIN